jgi:putative membrane protein
MNRMFQCTLAVVAGMVLSVGATAEDKKDTAKKDDKPFTDAEFVKKAASSGMHEVELGKLASSQGKSDEVKKFGQKMVDDHMKANEELKAAAKKASMEVPAKMEEEHQKHVEMLKGMKGDEFDRAYMKHMVESHGKSVALFTQASKEAKDAGLKDFATKTLPVVQGHLDMAKKMDKGGK